MNFSKNIMKIQETLPLSGSGCPLSEPKMTRLMDFVDSSR
jgi:hypothetical protein